MKRSDIKVYVAVVKVAEEIEIRGANHMTTLCPSCDSGNK